MVSSKERGDSTSRKRELDFASVAPWLCAALVLGVEAAEKGPAPVVGAAASSLALIFLILAGAALWSPTASRTDGAKHLAAENDGSATTRDPCAEMEVAKGHRLPIPSYNVATARFSS
jgi:hypothetical protein